MTILLDQVEHDRDAEIVRHNVVLEKYAQIEQLVTEIAELTGGTMDTMKPPPSIEGTAVPDPLPPELPAATGRPAGARHNAAVLAVIAESPVTISEIQARLGVSKASVHRTIARLRTANKIVEVERRKSPEGGRAAIVWALADETQSSGGAAQRPASGQAKPRTATPPAPPEDDPAQVDISGLSRETQRAADLTARQTAQTRGTQRNQHTKEDLVELLRAEPATAGELAEKLSLTTTRALTILRDLRKSGRAEIYGERSTPGKANTTDVWTLLPLPAERDDIVIHNGGGKVTETQVLECLRHGAYTLRELGQELDVSAADVGLTVSALELAGQVARDAHGGKYRALERTAA